MTNHYHINHHVQRFIVGFIAICLAILTNALNAYVGQEPLTSISASYHAGDWQRTLFVGFLFIIAAFLFSYTGNPEIRFQKYLSKIAAISAIGVAMFHCSCGTNTPEIIPKVHNLCASIMFLTLAYYCWDFWHSAIRKPTENAKRRVTVYRLCFLSIVLSIVLLVLDWVLEGIISREWMTLVFWGETLALVAFGVSWLTASRTIPVLTSIEERVSIFD